MSIIRIQKSENYVVLSKECLQDHRLSFKAKGLWAYCMSKPNDWQFNVAHLASVSKEKESAIYSALKELIKYGYCQKHQENQGKGEGNGRGCFGRLDYILYETCQIKNSFTQRDFQDAENSDAKNRALLNKEKELKKEKKKRAAPQPAASNISFNFEKREFENIMPQDLEQWKATYPNMNIQQQLKECANWAVGVQRTNYRRSINTWLKNASNGPKTAQIEKASMSPFTDEDVQKNRELANKLEEKLGSNGQYAVNAKPTEILFLMPENRSVSISYNMKNTEFDELCRKQVQNHLWKKPS